MSSWDHEGVIELFRREPKLVAELLGGPLRIELPPYTGARVESGALTQLNPAELRADLVIVLHEGERPTLGVVLEMQRERDEEKVFSWPDLAILWLDFRGPERGRQKGFSDAFPGSPVF